MRLRLATRMAATGIEPRRLLQVLATLLLIIGTATF